MSGLIVGLTCQMFALPVMLTTFDQIEMNLSFYAVYVRFFSVIGRTVFFFVSKTSISVENYR